MKFATLALIATASAVRLSDEKDHSDEFYEAYQDGQHFGKVTYHRVAPAWFTDDADDIFMRSMVMQYALEGKNKDGSPNHKFWMNEAQTKAAASEVLDTNKGMKEGRDAYLSNYFAKTWAHFDVNSSGMLEVIKMPQFMRFLTSDQDLHLS